MGWDIFFPPAILEIRQDSFITGIRGREQNIAKNQLVGREKNSRESELKRIEMYRMIVKLNIYITCYLKLLLMYKNLRKKWHIISKKVNEKNEII